MSEPKRRLTLFDAVCLIVGVIVGAGIYQFAPNVASASSTPGMVIALWVFGGLLSLMGAMCYAELASTYPQAGGDYVYLTRAYGPWAGFLFGWGQLCVVRPGDIASLSLIFAAHFVALLQPYPLWKNAPQHFAVAAILLLTLVHISGLREGKWTQNLLTIAKVAGILFVVVIAFLTPAAAGPTQLEKTTLPWSLAVIFVLFTYGGWNEMAYLAAEIHEPRKNVLRGLLIGSICVTLIYVVMNLAFLHVLGHAGLAQTETVGEATVSQRLPHVGGRLINALICISTLGAVSGLIFTGARISYALGRDYPLFRHLGHFERGSPTWALAVQGFLAGALVLVLGDEVRTVIMTSVAVYLFYAATSLAVIVMRFRDPAADRPYRVTGYPVTVIVFVVVAGYLFYNGVTYDPSAAATTLVLLSIGVILQFFLQRKPQSS